MFTILIKIISLINYPNISAYIQRGIGMMERLFDENPTD